MNRVIAWTWVFMVAAVLLYLVVIASALPDQLAVHFDVNGLANGFQSKSAFLYSFPVFIFILNGMFLATIFLIDRIPEALINIPWKKYWMSTPERKVIGFGKLKIVMGLVGIFVSTVLLLTVQIIYQANTLNPYLAIPGNLIIGFIFLLALLLIVAAFFITEPPDEN